MSKWLYAAVTFVSTTTIGIAQVPRGETGESIAGDADGALGAIWIFVVVAIIAGFKRSKSEGIKVLSAVATVALIYLLFPKVGMIIIALFGLAFVIGLFFSMK